MTRHHVEIRTEGTRGQVLIDGHDIAKAVTGLTFSAGVDQLMPRLYLDLQLIDVTELGSVEADVMLGNGVAEALQLLGWTPPKADQASETTAREAEQP
ncbi:hypothetical protein ABT275_03615 [Streptomyces sp. NPDC001185]|uniref:hypothetical protein n=1 Tax=Streptomyces sp. NPDC001185 TaxID=3154380 RepID=UPI00332283E9